MSELIENILKIIGFLTLLRFALRGLRIVIIEIVKEVGFFICSIKRIIYKGKEKKKLRVKLKEKKKTITQI